MICFKECVEVLYLKEKNDESQAEDMPVTEQLHDSIESEQTAISSLYPYYLQSTVL